MMILKGVQELSNNKIYPYKESLYYKDSENNFEVDGNFRLEFVFRSIRLLLCYHLVEILFLSMVKAMSHVFLLVIMMVRNEWNQFRQTAQPSALPRTAGKMFTVFCKFWKLFSLLLHVCINQM